MGVTRLGRAAALLLLFCAEPGLAAELRFCIRTDPKTFDPLLAAEEASETIRYLTAGVLIRFDRSRQQFAPELALSWKVGRDLRGIDFKLRQGVKFSNGASFSSRDVLATFRRIADPKLPSSVADAFRSGGRTVTARATGPYDVSISFSTPIAGLEMLFDQLAISQNGAAKPESAVLGAFMVSEYKGGQYVSLVRNPYYWKTDGRGTRLPYLDSIRLEIQSNRQTELTRFRRGELHMVDKLEPEAFDRLKTEIPAAALDLGASLDSEFFWFNQSSTTALPGYKREWFRSAKFRRAVSAAVNRDDIVRLVYRGHAFPAAGPVSQTNKLWFNTKLVPQAFDPKLALRLLAEDGFRLDSGTLRDHSGRPVEFSLITNAGSRTREQIGALLQQDLAKIGIRVNFTPMEFQSLIERITSTQEYEACLLGLTNVEVDPNSQINVWPSWGSHHAWNPGEAKPATSWEAEIDRLMTLQASTPAQDKRKRAFDRVQEIVAEQAPIIYLVHPHVLVALSQQVRNAAPSALPPHLIWNVEHISLAGTTR